MFANFLWEIVVACGWLKAAKAMPGRQADRQTDRETDKQTERDRQTPWPELFLSSEKTCAMYFSNCYCKTFQIHAADKVSRAGVREGVGERAWGG